MRQTLVNWFSLLFIAGAILTAASAVARPDISIYKDAKGFKLQVDGQDTFIKGINWEYVPKGANYSYNLWAQTDDYIKRVIDYEMGLMRDAGINAIRIYSNVPARWIRYIYENFGIYSVVNHTIGRYGFQVNSVWRTPTDYGDPATRKAILEDLRKDIESLASTPGILIWLLGNENNYGLVWDSFEIQNLPAEQQDKARAEQLYEFIGMAIDEVKRLDQTRPVAIANGDLQYIDLIKRYCKNLDIFGSNVYRGPDAVDYFETVGQELGIPTFFTEFGADAYNARLDREDDLSQAEYLKSQWRQIYMESYAHGSYGNSLGGLTFMWSDGWWKHQQETNLDIHDKTASWSNQGYLYDFSPSQNNMNEEWFGITAKGQQQKDGFFELIPRTAYYVLQDIYQKQPYQLESKAAIQQHFAAIDPKRLSPIYGRYLALNAQSSAISFTSHVMAYYESVRSGGNSLLRNRDGWQKSDYSQFYELGMDLEHSEVQASVTVSAVPELAQNKLDNVFYENRVERFEYTDEQGAVATRESIEEFELKRSSFTWNSEQFILHGYYRSGHGHWGYEGDFFGFYPESFDLANIDRYRGIAPVGFELEGQKQWESWKLAFGPQVYWGANPTVIAKYTDKLGPGTLSALIQHDYGDNQASNVSFVLPEPKTNRLGLHYGTKLFGLDLDFGFLHSGAERVGETFTNAQKSSTGGYRGSGYDVSDDNEIKSIDTLGFKVRVSDKKASFPWFFQTGIKGLVADSGVEQSITIAPWTIREAGRGNHYHAMLGAAIPWNDVQIAPLVKYQKPLVGPLPPDERLQGDVFRPDGTLLPGVAARNVLDDAFAVIDNREMTVFELLLTYDPTPSTWFYHWDRQHHEDADFAANLDLIYRKQPTTRDSLLGYLEDGTSFSFGGAPKAYDTWDITSFIVARAAGWKLLSGFYLGEGQANGSDEAIVHRRGFNLSAEKSGIRSALEIKLNDWGPYDYYRDFNLTYPWQAILDLSYTDQFGIGIDQQATIGLRYQHRELNERSPLYSIDSGKKNHEFEWNSYVRIKI